MEDIIFAFINTPPISFKFKSATCHLEKKDSEKIENRMHSEYLQNDGVFFSVFDGDNDGFISFCFCLLVVCDVDVDLDFLSFLDVNDNDSSSFSSASLIDVDDHPKTFVPSRFLELGNRKRY